MSRMSGNKSKAAAPNKESGQKEEDFAVLIYWESPEEGRGGGCKKKGRNSSVTDAQIT